MPIARALIVCCAVLALPARGVAQDSVPKWEIGGQFTVVRFMDFQPVNESLRQGGWPILLPASSERALGMRLTFNPTAALAIEAMANYFPGVREPASFHGGRKMHLVIGPKLGHRWTKVGLFGTAHVGGMGFEQLPLAYRAGELVPCGSAEPGPGESCRVSVEISAPGVAATIGFGGATEVYLSRNTVVRVDVGDSRVVYRGDGFSFKRDNVQVSIGMSRRFDFPRERPGDPDLARASEPPARPPIVPWLKSASALHVADTVTTVIYRDRYDWEANPVFLTPRPPLAVLWAVTGGTVAAEWIVLRKLHRYHPKWATAMTIGITGVEAMVVSLNLRNLRHR